MRGRILAGASTSTKVLVGLFAAHLLLKVVLFPYMSHAPLHGDERYYFDSARALSNLVRDLVGFGPVDTAELKRNLVGNGWFMPGNGILITPLFLVDPHASIVTIRLYLGVVTSLLLLITVIRVRHVLGDLYAAMLLVVPGLIPMWLLFSIGGWGDLVAGLLIVLLITELVSWIRTLRVGHPPSAWAAVRMGLISIAVVYARSSASILVLGMGIVVLFVSLTLLRGRDRVRAVLAGGLAGVVFLLLLAPWSLFASHSLGGRVITTTSVPTVLANTFGDRDELCYGPCDPTSTIWFTPVRYAREVARATDTNELVVLKEMSAYARQDVTPRSYADDVLMGFARYTFQPASFSKDVRSPDHSPEAMHKFILYATNVMWAFLAVSGIGLLLTVVRRTVDAQVISLLVTLGIGSLLTQPFVHIAGSRYWTSAAPLAGIAAALLLFLIDARRAQPRFSQGTWIMKGDTEHGSAISEPVISRWLTIVQTVLAAAVVLVAVGLVVLATI
ncbi:hypothetical protein EFK50_05055 [Nocardioides marmoriginsengisoli]|uniref:Glycosyltransferase RgtA/B/C/D-like domain-containing protein n=1 Tax=Nocardioides marmoriginsengisoli TaxID=661483 RepID=A0A3N0CPN7_9ACTN|nr:hypothetical protein [Nocardioides marmoriginsengisoli]RNL65330.1 hypothetical protein EFK50_05055 [Nocardioides marmoriginsengisoli]